MHASGVGLVLLGYGRPVPCRRTGPRVHMQHLHPHESRVHLGHGGWHDPHAARALVVSVHVGDDGGGRRLQVAGREQENPGAGVGGAHARGYVVHDGQGGRGRRTSGRTGGRTSGRTSIHLKESTKGLEPGWGRGLVLAGIWVLLAVLAFAVPVLTVVLAVVLAATLAATRPVVFPVVLAAAL